SGPTNNPLTARRITFRGSRGGDLLNLGGSQSQLGIFETGAAGQGENQFRLVAAAFARGAESGLGRGHWKTVRRQRAGERGGCAFDVEQRAPERQRVGFVGGGGENSDGERRCFVPVERGQCQHGPLPDLQQFLRAAQREQSIAGA